MTNINQGARKDPHIEKLDTSLNTYLKKQSWYQNLQEGKSVGIYNEITDSLIQNHSKASYSNQGNLLIQVDSPIVANEIKMRSSELIRRINDKMGFKAIQRLRFQIEETDKLKRVNQIKVQKITQQCLSKEELQSIQESTQDIEDIQIKQQVTEWFKHILVNNTDRKN